MHEARVDRDRLGEGLRQGGEELLDPEGRERNRARQREDLLRRRILRIHPLIINHVRVPPKARTRVSSLPSTTMRYCPSTTCGGLLTTKVVLNGPTPTTKLSPSK